MHSNLSRVRFGTIASALGLGLFAAEASAFQTSAANSGTSFGIQTPVPTPPIGPIPPSSPNTSKSTKDAATRPASNGSPAVASGQWPGIGVYAPLSSPQSAAPSSQGVGGYGSGGGMGGSSGSTSGSGMMGSGSGLPGLPGTSGGSSGATSPNSPTSPTTNTNAAPFGDSDQRASGGTGGSDLTLPNIIGDFGPSVRTAAANPVSVPPPYKVPGRTDVTSFIRVFKISENQSPRPQDRFFYTFNYFNNVDKSINRFDSSPITNINVYRHVFGFEKTFDQGNGSVGISLPLYSQFAKSAAAGLPTPGSTSLGDLNIFVKYILKENKQTGSLISTGLLVTPPTGPRYLAGSRSNYFPTSVYPGAFVPVHDLQIQPFLGYIFQRDRFYVQGFAALNVAVSPTDVSQFFNDLQFGYFLYRDRESDRFLTAIIPTFEAHISSPINHRGVASPDPAKNFQYDPYGTPDTVNLTYGINFEFRRNSILTFAFAQPVTSYRPFDYEAILLFNYRFGRSRSLVNPPPNVIGG